MREQREADEEGSAKADEFTPRIGPDPLPVQEYASYPWITISEWTSRAVPMLHALCECKEVLRSVNPTYRGAAPP